MTPEELASLARAMFGRRWVGPLARLVGRSPRAVRFWRNGEHRIPGKMVQKIRTAGELGPVGTIVRRAVREMVPDVDAWISHRVAQRILADLVTAGLLDHEAV
jgi:hypothetical protein